MNCASRLKVRVALIPAAALLLAACQKQSLPPKPYLAFVANQGSQSIAIIDLGTFSLKKVIGLSQHPNFIARRPQSHDLYVAGDAGLDILDAANLQLTGRWNFPDGISGLAFSADGSRAFLLDKSGGRIVIFDCQARRRTSVLKSPTRLTDLALTPNGKTLVADSQSKDIVYFIDPRVPQILGSVQTGHAPGSLVVSQDGSKVYVADVGENLITVADLGARALFTHLEISDPPTLLILKPDGGEIFALSASGTRLTVLDATQATVEQMAPTGHDPVAGIFTLDSSRFYWANKGDGTVSAMDVATRQVLASTRVGVSPQALALTPDGRFLIVADGASSGVEVVEAASTRLLTAIPAGAQPVSIVIPGEQQ